MKKKVFGGIDIGGTKIAVAFEDQNGERIAARRLPTETSRKPFEILETISQAIEEMLAENDAALTAIGIGCPGPIDIKRGLALSASNLPGWDDLPVGGFFTEKFGVPVLLDNDANAAGLGEYFYGAGRGFGDIFYMTVSTGIGGAIISGGQIYHGVHANAGEVGHTVVEPDGRLCACGTKGCLDAIASGTSIARRMKEALTAQTGGNTENFDAVTSEKVVELVRKGNLTARAVWDETIKFLAIGIHNVINFIAPEAIVIGGGVSAAGELLFEPLRNEIKKNAAMAKFANIKILKASLGGESGVCGALILARRASKNNLENG